MTTLHSRYSLEDEIGKGGMGVVYRAFDRLEGYYVALKRIEVDPSTLEMNPLIASPRYQHMLLAHEFRTLAALRHPNIVTVLDYGFTSKRHPFFVMELLDASQTIVQAAEGQDVRVKVDLLIQMLQAIMYLHHHKILHRDLKPNNVLVNQMGQVKVLDFGLAIKSGEQQERGGTIYYMAPEVLNNQPASEASDLYAVGVMAYKLFTGLEPFRSNNYSDLLDQIWSSAPDMTLFDPLAVDHPAVQDIATIIAYLLDKNPANRYPTALAVVRALCQAIGEALPPDEGPMRESFLQAATFVGRDSELQELQWVLKKAKEKHGSAWLVGGESGIGKSRLLDELRIHALAEDVMVLRGQIIEENDSLRHCWAEILRPLLLSIPISDTEASILQAIIPDIYNLLGMELPAGTAPRGWSNSIIAELFSRITHPTLLLLEDLQWAKESLEPLKTLIPLLANLPVLVVGSYRTEDRPHLPEQLQGINLLMLGKLSYDDIAALSTSMLGDVGQNPYILDLLYKETDGNAFFMVEVVRAWAEEAGQLNEVGQFVFPTAVFTGGIQHIIQRRLKKVPGWAYGGLQVAAVMGRQLNLAVLDIILSPILGLMTGDGISVTISTVWREERGLNLNDWLLVCADAAILEVYDGDWRFTHDKLREQILGSLDGEQMRLLHSQVERALKLL